MRFVIRATGMIDGQAVKREIHLAPEEVEPWLAGYAYAVGLAGQVVVDAGGLERNRRIQLLLQAHRLGLVEYLGVDDAEPASQGGQQG